MTKAVFTTKITPSYNDLPEVRYHFPQTYLNQARQAVGDHVVYYEPRRSSAKLSSIGGRQSYFGMARLTAIVEDTKRPDHYYALTTWISTDPFHSVRVAIMTRALSRKETEVQIRERSAEPCV
jgi:hypothetical protein